MHSRRSTAFLQSHWVTNKFVVVSREAMMLANIHLHMCFSGREKRFAILDNFESLQYHIFWKGQMLQQKM